MKQWRLSIPEDILVDIYRNIIVQVKVVRSLGVCMGEFSSRKNKILILRCYLEVILSCNAACKVLPDKCLMLGIKLDTDQKPSL